MPKNRHNQYLLATVYHIKLQAKVFLLLWLSTYAMACYVARWHVVTQSGKKPTKLPKIELCLSAPHP